MSNNLCWLRRDLRLHDHAALSAALSSGNQTFIVFNFDPEILINLPKDDKRITFIYDSLCEIEKHLNEFGSSLIITHGNPVIEIEKIIIKYNIDQLYFNRDYEPMAKSRDEKIIKNLGKKAVKINTFKDHVFFEKHEILNLKREVYKVFTPYKNKWLEEFREKDQYIPNFKTNLKNLAKFNNPLSINELDWLNKIHFKYSMNDILGGTNEAKIRLKTFEPIMHEYTEMRNFPYKNMTSNISPYLRMGNISIRDCMRLAISQKNSGSETYLSELIWRDFYQMFLDVYPRIENTSYKINYDSIKWVNNKENFEAWKNGLTGYPLVDAAMRCLNQTGFMHNRLRMVVASFFTKTLLMDWRLGEKYFALKLMDYDMAANIGGWQWSASTGVDAQPYFRIFNPFNQSEKFDKEGIFIKNWCPELVNFDKKYIHYPHEAEFDIQAKANCFIGKDYPAPIVAYKSQKEKILKMFKAIKSEN